MEMNDVEALHVKQRKILQEVYEYVCGEALEKDLYNAENDLFRYVLRIGYEFLREVIARHGTGKIEGQIKAGDDLPYHVDKETTYKSVFGEVKINRAYYWRKA